MGLNRRKLKEWVSRRCITPPPPASFALMHVGRQGALALVCKLEAEGAPDDRANAVERLVSEEASDHVEGWPGLQQYKVVALDQKDEPVGEHPFTLQSGAREDNAATLGMPTPDMGPAGAESLNHAHTMVTIQQMRHNEGLVTALVDMASASRERDQAIIETLQSANDKMSHRQLDLIDLVEGMLTRKQERELTQQAYEEDKGRKDAVLAKVVKYILPAFAKEAGVPLPDDVATTVKEIFLRLPAATQTQIIEELPEVDGEKLLALMEGNTEETTH